MKITQIIPADNWYAQIKTGTGYVKRSLICWALTEEGDIVGILHYDGIMPASEVYGFDQYIEVKP